MDRDAVIIETLNLLTDSRSLRSVANWINAMIRCLGGELPVELKA